MNPVRDLNFMYYKYINKNKSNSRLYFSSVNNLRKYLLDISYL